MNPRLEQALADLSSADPTAVQEAIVLIGEVATFNRRGIKSEAVPEANEENLGWGELQVLERGLIDFVEGAPLSPNAGSAIHALSKFCDREIIKTYQRWLQGYVDQFSPAAFAVGQLVVALSDLGERVITGGSFSADDFGKNYDDAVAYLKRRQQSPTSRRRG